jgi:hypothetical protein
MALPQVRTLRVTWIVPGVRQIAEGRIREE